MLEWVTDGGLETDLIFHKGLELPEFAAFPLRVGSDFVLQVARWRFSQLPGPER